MRCDRLATQASHTNHLPNSRHHPQFAHLPISQTETHLSLQHASNVGSLLPQPDMTAHLQRQFISEVRRFGISSADFSVNSHANSINIDFPQASSSAMSSAQLHEVNIFDLSSATDWTSFQIPVEIMTNHQDSDSFEIAVDVHQAPEENTSTNPTLRNSQPSTSRRRSNQCSSLNSARHVVNVGKSPAIR
ncbi:hypothetical protein FRX31_015781 [Thalictrum thalictroides]|uniref:Uncharacterized protein n=1 Tax=Thalictrum thalictroides TaxID=46969 RepID=A0A7J6WEV9_THATH|nr:hypothetical protein FRX31_015781 [Thalictrum thalictroides]